jgi:dTDP-4-amino-4,6-dideoxygalactose transaminase
VPVFVDVDPRTFTIDTERARAAITDRTRAILAVHMAGQMADMAPLLELAEAHDLIVVEDAAQAHGATYRDPASGTAWKAGSVGHFGCFSLSDVKNVGTLGTDAGAIAISQRATDRFGDVAARARAWRDTGRCGSHRYHHQAWGIRARMDEYSAAECAAELDLLDGWNERRRTIAARFAAALADGPVAAPYVAPGRSHAFFNFLAKPRDVAAREALVARMGAAAIAPADTYTVVADQEMYRDGVLPNRCAGSLDTSRALERLLVPIPCFPELTEEEIMRIEAVLEAIAPARRFTRARAAVEV